MYALWAMLRFHSFSNITLITLCTRITVRDITIGTNHVNMSGGDQIMYWFHSSTSSKIQDIRFTPNLLPVFFPSSHCSQSWMELNHAAQEGTWHVQIKNTFKKCRPKHFHNNSQDASDSYLCKPAAFWHSYLQCIDPYHLCWASHVLPVSVWVSSGFSGFLQPPDMPELGSAMLNYPGLNVCEYVSRRVLDPLPWPEEIVYSRWMNLGPVCKAALRVFLIVTERLNYSILMSPRR